MVACAEMRLALREQMLALLLIHLLAFRIVTAAEVLVVLQVQMVLVGAVEIQVAVLDL
jgi:hypothetical protein